MSSLHLLCIFHVFFPSFLGGNFRGKFGRFIYENDGLYQHILREDDIKYDNNGNDNITSKVQVIPTIPAENFPQESSKEASNESPLINSVKKSRILAINYISGRLFKIITVSVILKGVISLLSDSERTQLTARYGTALSSGTVRADFEAPLITIGGLSVSIGPISNVVLDTPYLDEKIRLGVGARGSVFIFRKTMEEKANYWIRDVARKPLNAKKLGLFLLFFGGLLSSINVIENILFRIVKNVISFFLFSFGGLFLFTKGGIRDDPLTMKKEN